MRTIKDIRENLKTIVESDLKEDQNHLMSLDEVQKQDGYYTKHDPRVKKGFPSDKKIPNVLVLKRKAIRVYPDDQKVALYYSQVLDKYITIPFGENVPGINEENIQELKTQTYQSGAVKRSSKEPQKSDYDSDDEYIAALAKHNAKMDLYKRRIKKSSVTDIPWQETKLKIKAVRKQKDKDGEKGRFISGLRPDDPVYSAGYALGYGATKLAQKLIGKYKDKKTNTKKATPKPPTSLTPFTPSNVSPTIKSGGEQPNIPASYGKNVDIPVQKPLSPEAKPGAEQPAQPKMFSPTAPNI